eukprot:6893454-Lingulodinium_polyedra.AAC.1
MKQAAPLSPRAAGRRQGGQQPQPAPAPWAPRGGRSPRRPAPAARPGTRPHSARRTPGAPPRQPGGAQ